MSLLDNIYELFVQYYNDAYDRKFVIIADAAFKTLTEDLTIILYINQYGYIRIGSKVA